MQKTSVAAGILVICTLLGVSAAAQDQGPTRIFADPEVRVSYDGNVTHMEAPIAASATDPDLLYASAQLVVPGRGYGVHPPQAYYSHDAGATWNGVLLPGEISKISSWDSSIAAGKKGTAYFTTNRNGQVVVYRTQDGGQTWIESPTHTPQSWDRPYSVVDNTDGPNAGRLYIAGESRAPGGLHVMTSSDGGKTFSTPVPACKPPEHWNAATEPHPVVLSDGTLIVRCNFYPNDFKVRMAWQIADFGVVASTDGGQSFSAFRSAGQMDRQRDMVRVMQFKAGDLVSGGRATTAMAVAPPGAPFADRLYIALSTLGESGHQQVYLIHSDDRGVTWGERRAVDPIRPPATETSRQGVPLLAVNKDGVVGIAWFDSRNVQAGKGYDIYFSASLDGGETFLPAQRITSASSHPRQGGASIIPNFSVGLSQFVEEDKLSSTTIMFASPYNVRWLGGDFSTMTVDAGGRFHPMWPDARDGTWQLYTSTIRVVPGLNQEHPRVCAREEDLKLVLGEPQWNEEARELSVPVQLRNVSNETFVSPIRLSLQTLDNIAASPFGAEMVAAFPPAQLLQKQFEYGISRDRPLFPNGVTDALLWRMSISQPEEMTSTLRVKIENITEGCAHDERFD